MYRYTFTLLYTYVSVYVCTYTYMHTSAFSKPEVPPPTMSTEGSLGAGRGVRGGPPAARSAAAA